MDKRIKKLRKALDLTQQTFADRLGIKQNTIAKYETGRGTPTRAVVSLICREFNVNEEWLRTGNGEMFVQRTRADELSSFVDQLLQSEPDDIRRRFVTAISRLSTKELEVLERTALHLTDELSSADQNQTQAEWEREADEFAAMAREQFLSEKRRESQASSAKGSGGPGGAA